MTNQELMRSIYERWGKTVSAQCKASILPESFLAALIANESWGYPKATRFEPGVFAHLISVRDGKESHYGSIDIGRLRGWQRAHLIGWMDDDVHRLATSWGLTQIMGYNAVFHGEVPESMQDPSVALPMTLRMLAEDAERFGLDLTKDFVELFTCWNAGNPFGHPVPGYVDNGLARMKAYEEILKQEAESCKSPSES